MNTTPTEVLVTDGSLMFGGSNDPRVGKESMWLSDHTEMTVTLSSVSSDCPKIAIAYAYYYPEIVDVVGGGDVELSPEQARWLAAYLLRAAESCGDGAESDPPRGTRG